jgi:hypothetical protein
MHSIQLTEMPKPQGAPGPRPGTSANPAGAKHHYIPVGYLKQWVGPDGRLCEFSRPYFVKPGIAKPTNMPVKPRMTYPDGTGYIRGLYTFPTLPSAIASALEERFLLQADNDAFTALQQLVRGNANINAEQRCGWSRFIMTLIHRTPQAIVRYAAKLKAEYPAYIEKLLIEMPKELRNSTTPEITERLRAGLSHAALERMLFHSLRTMMDSEFLGNALNCMSLIVLEFDNSHHPLLTSDRPIVMTNGLNKTDSHMVIPISPRRLVVMANKIEVLRQIEELARSGGLAQRMNNRMARQARKYVYGTDDQALKFVEERLGERAAWSPLE